MNSSYRIQILAYKRLIRKLRLKKLKEGLGSGKIENKKSNNTEL
jgi:hypothetical protein